MERERERGREGKWMGERDGKERVGKRMREWEIAR